MSALKKSIKLGCAIPLGLLILAVFISWFNSLPKTGIPIAPKSVLSQLPGTIIMDDPLDCTDSNGCEGFMGSRSGLQALRVRDKKDYYPPSPEWPDNKVYEYVFPADKKISLVNRKTGQIIPLITEKRYPIMGCWSPDNRYLLYNVNYIENDGLTDEVYLYLLYDTKTNQTYRFFKNAMYYRRCAWIKARLNQAEKVELEEIRI